MDDNVDGMAQTDEARNPDAGASPTCADCGDAVDTSDHYWADVPGIDGEIIPFQCNECHEGARVLCECSLSSKMGPIGVRTTCRACGGVIP